MLKQYRPGLVSTLVLTVVFGLLFPFVITAIAQVAFPHQANGSLIVQGGKVIGSELIGQSFAAPKYFHPRPSAAGSGYDATSSQGTNLGPTSDKLINGVHKKLPNGKDDPNNFDGIKDLAAAYRKENGMAANAPVPPDAVTRSASGLDPHISPGPHREPAPEDRGGPQPPAVSADRIADRLPVPGGAIARQSLHGSLCRDGLRRGADPVYCIGGIAMPRKTTAPALRRPKTTTVKNSRSCPEPAESRTTPAAPEGADPAVQLLDEWLADESGYEEENWPKLKEALDRDRLSSRPLFPNR